MWRLASILLVLTLLACSDGGGTGMEDAAAPDAGPDGTAIDPDAPIPPDIPWLEEGAPPLADVIAPRMTPCAAGWRELFVDSVAACDPYPAAGPSACAPHEAHFPGAPGCERIGTSCGSDGWPAGLPSTGVVYVRAGSSGDGSRGAPFGRIADAVSFGATTLALAEGRYDESVSLGAGVALVGACTEGTVLTRTVTMAGAGSRLENLSIRGANVAIAGVADGSVRDVVVDAATGTGVRVSGGTLSLERVAIRGVVASGGFGQGLAVTTGASASLDHVTIEASAGDAVSVSGTGASVDLVDSSLRGSGGFGIALSSNGRVRAERASLLANVRGNVSNTGASLELVDTVLRGDGTAPTLREGQGLVQPSGDTILSRVLFAENGWAGIDVWAGSLTATDLIVHDTAPAVGEARSGYGINAYVGSFSIERALFFQNAACGVAMSGAVAHLTDITVADTRESTPTETRATFGTGLSVSAPDTVLERIRARGNVRTGLALYGEDVHATLRDVHVSDTRGSMADGEGGEGIFVFLGATVTAERIVVERSEFAAYSIREGATFTATDLVARDVTAPNNFGISGYGLRMESAGVARVSRALIERIDLAGIHVVEDGSSITASDLVVREMLGEAQFGLHGWGLGATNGGVADLERARFTRPRYVGLVTSGVGSRLTAVDLVLEDTLQARCADDLCAAAPFGIGLGAYGGGVVNVESFLITRSHVIGVQLAGDGSVDLADGEVSMSPVGANVQGETFEIDRLTEGVSYRENQQNLVTDSLPVPSFGGVE